MNEQAHMPGTAHPARARALDLESARTEFAVSRVLAPELLDEPSEELDALAGVSLGPTPCFGGGL